MLFGATRLCKTRSGTSHRRTCSNQSCLSGPYFIMSFLRHTAVNDHTWPPFLMIMPLPFVFDLVSESVLIDAISGFARVHVSNLCVCFWFVRDSNLTISSATPKMPQRLSQIYTFYLLLSCSSALLLFPDLLSSFALFFSPVSHAALPSWVPSRFIPSIRLAFRFFVILDSNFAFENQRSAILTCDSVASLASPIVQCMR